MDISFSVLSVILILVCQTPLGTGANQPETEQHCPSKHYKYSSVRNVNVPAFKSRWNFNEPNPERCEAVCNQLINWECKTFLFQHAVPGSDNVTQCMLSDMSEYEIEPVQHCFGSMCKNDLYYRDGCINATCDKNKCPDVNKSICNGPGEKLWRFPKTKDTCCELAECICNKSVCPEPVNKSQSYGVVAGKLSDDCCPKWEYTCNTSLCPIAKEQCKEQGQVQRPFKGPCCQEYNCDCDASLCLPQQKCTASEETVVSPLGPCCNITFCKPLTTASAPAADVLAPEPINTTAGAVHAPPPGPQRTPSRIYPNCRDHGEMDRVWCEVLTRVEDAEEATRRVWALVTAFLILVTIAVCCGVTIMAVTFHKVGKNKLA